MLTLKVVKEADMHVGHDQLDNDAVRFTRENPALAPEANSASSVSIDNIMSIDHAVQLTIEEMPNALRLLENS